MNDERQLSGADAGIVEVLSLDGAEHVGMGILLAPRLVLTCAHVVNIAIREDELKRGAPPPVHKPHVRFPLCDNAPTVSGQVVAWREPGPYLSHDLALISLDEDAPSRAGVATLVVPADPAPRSETLTVFGIPPNQRTGKVVEAQVMGRANQGWVQIDALDKDSGVFIQPGFSGGAVWGDGEGGVVGMVVARYLSKDELIAYMIPSGEIVTLTSGIPFEERKLNPAFGLIWTASVVALFLLMLVHFLTDRIGGFPKYLSLANGNRQVADLFGMCIGAIGLPVIFVQLRSFARSRRLQRWWRRVPRTWSRNASFPQAATSPAMAATTLAVVVIAMLYMQGHFIRRFHVEGHVYAYLGPFGYSRADAIAQGMSCETGSGDLCTFPCAGRYSLIQPRPNSPGGYFDNMYHYGELDGAQPNSVTFFPILQPSAVIAATAGALMLAALALWSIFRRPGAGRRPLR